MIHLNKIVSLKNPTKKEPEIKEFNIGEKKFLYDPNSMDLYLLGNEQDSFKICGSDFAEFFPLMEVPRHKGYLVLQATYACNLACNYCFVRHHYPDHSNCMHLDTAVDAIKQFQPDYKQRGINIGFFGGEPLMNWELIYQLMDWSKKEIPNKKNRFHITTNGTLITQEIAEFIVKEDISLIVSLDGERDYHNSTRPYANGNTADSWADTMRGLEFLYQQGKAQNKPSQVCLRSTFDKNGVELVKTIAFLNDLMYKGYAGHVSCEPSCLAESCKRETFEGIEEEEIFAKFEDQYFQAAKWFRDEIRKGRKPSFHHFEIPMQRISQKQPAISECGAGVGYVSVGPDGRVSACHREHESIIGNMYTGIDKSLQESWRDNRYYNRIGCNSCWQRNICGGGCRCNSALVYKNLWMPSKVECIFKDMQTRAVFWLLSELTPSETRLYQKLAQNQNFETATRVSGQEKKDLAVCSNPNNCPDCKEKIQERTAKYAKIDAIEKARIKQTPVCGLKICLGKSCPFESCGKKTEEQIKKVLERKDIFDYIEKKSKE